MHPNPKTGIWCSSAGFVPGRPMYHQGGKSETPPWRKWCGLTCSSFCERAAWDKWQIATAASLRLFANLPDRRLEIKSDNSAKTWIWDFMDVKIEWQLCGISSIWRKVNVIGSRAHRSEQKCSFSIHCAFDPLWSDIILSSLSQGQTSDFCFHPKG